MGALYLGPIVGRGTDADPYRAPYLGDPRVGALLLGPPGTADGVSLLWLPEAVQDARLVKVADSPFERATVAGRRRFANRLQVSLWRTATYADHVAALLLNHGRRDGRGWYGVRGWPSKVRARHEIWLGELGRIWSRPALVGPSTKRFTETWPTNGTTISSGQDQVWTELNGDSEVVAGVLRAATTGTAHHVLCDSVLDTPYQRHIAAFTMTGQGLTRLLLRAADLSNHYIGDISNDGAVGDNTIRKRVAGSLSTLASNTHFPSASGTFVFTVDGATVTCSATGITTMIATDPSPELLTNFKGGAAIFATTDVAHITLDNHTIADLEQSSHGMQSDLARRHRPRAFAPSRPR